MTEHKHCNVAITLGGKNGLTSGAAKAYAEHIVAESGAVAGVTEQGNDIFIEFNCRNYIRDGVSKGKCLKQILATDNVDVSSVAKCAVETTQS